MSHRAPFRTCLYQRPNHGCKLQQYRIRDKEIHPGDLLLATNKKHNTGCSVLWVRYLVSYAYYGSSHC